MWDVETKAIPVITIRPNITEMYLSNTPGNHKIEELQKTAILVLHTCIRYGII
jgi:hypothetical protein